MKLRNGVRFDKNRLHSVSVCVCDEWLERASPFIPQLQRELRLGILSPRHEIFTRGSLHHIPREVTGWRLQIHLMCQRRSESAETLLPRKYNVSGRSLLSRLSIAAMIATVCLDSAAVGINRVNLG